MSVIASSPPIHSKNFHGIQLILLHNVNLCSYWLMDTCLVHGLALFVGSGSIRMKAEEQEEEGLMEGEQGQDDSPTQERAGTTPAAVLYL